MILKWVLIFFIQFILQLKNRVHIKCNKVVLLVQLLKRWASIRETPILLSGHIQWIETNPYKSINKFIHLLNN